MEHWKDTWDVVDLESTLCLFPIPCEYLLCDHGEVLILSEPCFALNRGIVDVMVLLKVLKRTSTAGVGSRVLVSAGTFPPSE